MSTEVTPAGSRSLTAIVAMEIKVAMTRRGVRQSDLARTLGKSEQWVSVRLRGVQPIDLNDLQAIADVLNIDVWDLIPRRPVGSSEGRLIATASAQGGQDQQLNVRKGNSPIHTYPSGQSKRTSTTASTRRPVRLFPAHAQ